MTGSLNTAKEAQALAWSIHNAAADKAKRAGACRRCCAEAGFRATDKAGLHRRTQNDYQMHQMCAQRIQSAK